jgi:hypothetical protein
LICQLLLLGRAPFLAVRGRAIRYSLWSVLRTTPRGVYLLSLTQVTASRSRGCGSVTKKPNSLGFFGFANVRSPSRESLQAAAGAAVRSLKSQIHLAFLALPTFAHPHASHCKPQQGAAVRFTKKPNSLGFFGFANVRSPSRESLQAAAGKRHCVQSSIFYFVFIAYYPN